MLLNLGHATLTSHLVALIVHLHIILWEALGRVLGKELAVSTIKDIHLWIGEVGIVGGIDSPVVAANKLCGKGCTVHRVLTVEDEQGIGRGHVLSEELVGQMLLVVEVDCALNVTSFVFILKSTIDDQHTIILVRILLIQDIEHGLLRDSG